MNKQIQLVAILLILPIIGFAQNKFSFGVNVNAQASLMKITDSKALPGLYEKSGVAPGYSIGTQIQYYLNQKIFLRSGIGYQSRRSRHKIEGLKLGTDLMNGTVSTLQNDVIINSIGVPIEIACLIGTKNEKLKYLVGWGGTFNLNTGTKTKAKILHDKIDDEELTSVSNEVDASIFSIGIFGGVDMQLSDRLVLGIEPNFRFTPNKFILFIYRSEAKSTMETGITLRLRMK